jgi:lipopolysaccharide/colanic/teichoic acid biosynthesis glycosyltransferase
MPKTRPERLWRSALLAVLAPLLALIAVLIKLVGGPGLVLRRERRLNAAGAPYLASALPCAASLLTSGARVHGTGEEARPTPVGAWLSRHHLDDLPKLMNVRVRWTSALWTSSKRERAGEQQDAAD